jgi:hypothetical protein
VTIRPRTKLLNSAVRPDPKIVEYLQREFGREILTKSPWKVVPKNKKLKLHELITLFRYHYWRTWEKDYAANQETFSRWPVRREVHQGLLADFKNILVRYGFDGYGNPKDDNGIVVFSGDRVTLAEVLGELPEREHQELLASDFRRLKDIEQLRSLLKSHGLERAKKLAAQVRSPLGS